MAAAVYGAQVGMGAELPVEPLSGSWKGTAWMATKERTAQAISPPLTQIEWTNVVASFGSGLSVVAGDVGDPRPWLLVGARALRVGERRVGGVLGLRHEAATGGWAIEFGLAGASGDSFYGDDLVAVRDVNGDGREDLLVYCARPLAGTPYQAGWVLHVSHSKGWHAEPGWVLGSRVAAPLGFGHMASAGDVNGDGFGDVVIGVPNANGERGIAMLYLGSSQGLGPEPAWAREGEQAGELFGFGVAGVGDVNGDGWDDVFVGAPGHREKEGQRGRWEIFLGDASGLSREAHGSASGLDDAAWFGAAAAPAGDIDGDGCADFLVSAPGPVTRTQRNPGWPGSISLFAGERRSGRHPPRVLIQGVRHTDWFGRSFGVVGDMDGDGEVELAVGVPRAAMSWPVQGRVEVWTVRRDFSVIPRIMIEGTAPGQRLGWRVAGADFNQDGLADLVATGPFHMPANANSGHGMVAVVWGSPEVFARHPALRSQEMAATQTAGIEVEDPVPHTTARDSRTMLWAAGAAGLVLLGAGALGCWWRRREVEVVRRERQRFARDLHDQVGGYLTHLGLVSDRVRQQSTEPLPQRDANEQWLTVSKQLSDGLTDVIWLAREDTKQLEALLDRIIDTATTWLDAAGIACRLRIPPSLPEVPVDPGFCWDVLLVFKEAVNNLIRHSKATCAEIDIHVTEGRWLDVQVADNGAGFDPPAILPTTGGLSNMKFRVESGGGSWNIESDPRGTRVRYRMDLNRAARV